MRTDKHLLPLAILVVAATATLLFGAISCGDSDSLDFEDGKLKAGVTIPLLPIDLPILPTDVTLAGAADSITKEAEDRFGVDISSTKMEEVSEDVEDDLRDASLEVLQPGVLSVAVNDRISEIIRGVVSVTRVGVNFGFKNNTDTYVATPVQFKLFLGDGEEAEAFDEAVSIPFADPQVDEDGQFVVPPGEEIELSIENVPHLVSAINDSATIGVGYQSIYKVADTEEGADIEALVTEFGCCLAKAATSGIVGGIVDALCSADTCPGADELLNWNLALTKFEIEVEAESDLDVPDLEDCADFASSLGLDEVADACP
ncbi:MAG: hypothetical protein H6684_00680 [Deltaproteobacteria bacterium]|nr:hypothetical protein [bacterium]MCB9476087.1 hypothetical protein [Deltaproteobacteria bacterium]MCB9478223.1 hypothetical protein [Deltaproteobacteria bacterium]MCB9487224.1 hypothetical protein [Deltaproteobacteria bacterium]